MTVDLDEYVVARRPTLVRSAVLLGCTLEDAEDLVQTTLARCLKHWRRVSRADRIDAYVYRMLMNALRDTRARRWTGEIPTEELPDRAAAEVDVTTGLAVRLALAKLPEQHREVLVLRFYADLSERETAEALGIAAGTVKSRTSRALAALGADATISRSDDAH